MKAQLHRKVVTVKRKGKTFHQARMVKSEAAPASHGMLHTIVRAHASAAMAHPIFTAVTGGGFLPIQAAVHYKNNRAAYSDSRQPYIVHGR